MSEPEPTFSAEDLARLEFLGDNCELGFVLERLGSEQGALLRWAAITPESLLATLRADFAHLYDFENLVPFRHNMVHDQRYGTDWHSEMRSTFENGVRRFNHDKATRRSIYAHERQKRDYLLRKLRRKFEHPNPLFVIKCNEGIDPPVLEAIHYQLYRLVPSPDFALLEVCADPSRAGTVESRGRNLLRGYVAHHAPYEDAEAADDRSWRALLREALSRTARAREALAPSEPDDPISLPFPLPHPTPLRRAIEADRRAGAVLLHHGNEWCRPVEGDFRLHARAIGEAATTMTWCGVLAPPRWTLNLVAAWAIPDSLPLRATLTATAATGAARSTTGTFDDGAVRTLTLALPDASPAPLTLQLTVEPLAPLAASDRAVIDLRSAVLSEPA